MKLFTLLILFTASVSAEVPEIFKGLFEEEVPVKASIGMVELPPEIDKFNAKFEIAARKNPDPKWFKEYAASSDPGAPLPFHENLGLTKEEYDEYIALWSKRTFKSSEEVILVLRKTLGGTWTLTATGGAGVISTLRYDSTNDTFLSPSGKMERLADINTDEKHVLGAWSGKEWRFQETSLLGLTKQNFAIGKFDKGEYGIVLYLAQEVSPQGLRTHENTLVLRFPLGRAGQIKPQAAPVKPR
jgi:hypothetical protein